MTNLNDSILSSALIGTERRPFTPQPGDDAAGALIGGLDSSDGERALLGAAAIAAQYQRAGSLPGKSAKKLPEPAPDETLPRVSPASAQHLMTMHNGRYTGVLLEWLEAAAGAGKRAPEESLPALLGIGAKNATLRGPIASVIGERGRWLGGLNKAWSYAAGGEDDDWQTAGTETRLALLRALRASDPEAARGLVETTWDSERAEDRVEFITCFATGLSANDEPLLERCLDDRSSKVRLAAAQMLARLPGSQLSERMIARAGAAVVLGKGARPQISVTLPEMLDEATRRDGIEDVTLSLSGASFGEKSAWLLQMISLTPPEYWCERFGKSPQDLLASAARTDEWAMLLMHGWHRAARLHGATDWLMALMSPGYVASPESLSDLPPAVQDQIILAVYDTSKFELADRLHLFEKLDHVWSRPLAEKSIKTIQELLKIKQDKRDWSSMRTLELAGYRLPPDMVEYVQLQLRPDDEGWERYAGTIRGIIDTMEFRKEMLEELSK